MRITVLLENETVREDLEREHGIALHIESGGRRFLFDTGASGSFVDNAERLGIDVAGVDIAVLSHGHYDHTGGLRRFFETNTHAPVYIAEKAREPKYSLKRGHQHFVGTDIWTLDAHADRLRSVTDVVRIADNAWLSPILERPDPAPTGNDHLYVVREEGRIPDPFEDEIFLALQEGERSVVVTGCSHAGIVNVVGAARTLLHTDRIDYLIGGFHLVGESEHRMARIAAELYDTTGEVYTGHCTERPGYEALRKVLEERAHYAAGGRVIEI